jgi:acyl-[acyl-carrier-protein]-phospholipid O-acyltransferase/long-chain-fatty-acid--[acyl-carrier-protein] ligase
MAMGSPMGLELRQRMIALLRFLLRLCFRFRAYDEGVLKEPGPVLLLSNHVSWFDWLLLGVCLEDDWRFVTSSDTARTSWLHRKIMVNRRTFPVENKSPFAVRHMAEYLQTGGRLVLFPEGRLSQTGSLMKLFDGTGFLIYKTRAKVITAYLRNAHRLPFSPHRGSKRWFPRVSAHFSPIREAVHQPGESTTAARGRITDWLRDLMIRQQFDVEMRFGPRTLPEAIADSARQWPQRVVLQDLTLQRVNYRRLCLGANLLAGQWKSLIPSNARRVGVLLPNVSSLPATLLSLWRNNHVPAILNYTTGPTVLLSCCKLAGIQQVVTSHAFLSRFKLDPTTLTDAGIELLYLEDVRARIPAGRTLTASLASRFTGPTLRSPQQPDDTAVILFTSGSEGVPKGVELSHRNLLANLRQMCAVADLTENDRFFNALPLFHSFGLTVGLLLPLARGAFTFLYPSPLHYRVVPTALYDLNATVFFATNTFLAGYARKAHPYDFRSVRYLFAGAEKLQESTVQTWARRFGIRILEGYGATECSPCISVNTPMRPRPGSAGEFLPGIHWKLEPVEGVADGGRLFVQGPNVMRGYVNPEANAQFQALNGWYDTGDIASVDEGKYVRILGRLKRFAKISGEMVSLTAVEEALDGAFPHYGLRFAVAVVARPDPDKGERLIAVSNEPRLTLDEVRTVIKARGLSNLAVPRELKTVREIPKLGTGKINHRELARLIA